MSISSELLTLNNTKQAIKTSINQKGGSITENTPFADYSTAIDNLPSGGSGNKLLTSIDVSDFTGTTFNTAASYITSATIPSGVTSIGNNAFSGCTSLTSVTIPSGVTSIGLNAFQNCNKLTSINIPNTVTSFGNYAFSGCGFTSFTIPNSVTSIGTNVFQGSGLTSFVFPGRFTTLPNSTFQNCSKLTSVTIESGVVTIGISAFMNCGNLTDVVIPNTVTTIMGSAFQSCIKLESITIPTSVTNIGGYAFQNNTRLSSFICLPTTPPTLDNANAFTNTNNCPIYVPAESVDTYKAASGWSTYASRIFAIEQIATVDGNPVYNYEIGETDSVIGNTEMGNMPTGTSIEFAEGVTRIQGIINGYTTVTLPSTLLGLDNLQNIIGSSVTTLTMKSTTPPTAQANNPGGAGLTAIYVPASAVSTYQSDAAWSSFSSIIQAIPE